MSIPHPWRLTVSVLRPIDHWFIHQVLPHEAQFIRAARRWLRDADEARDLVQEVFTRLFTQEGWASISNPPAYVLRMLRNLAVERIRRARIIEFQRLADMEGVEFVDEAADPFRAAAARDQVRRIRAVLEKMPEEYRAVLIQRRLADQSVRDMARATGISLSTLEKRLARAIALFNAGLRAYNDGTLGDEGASERPTRAQG